MRRSVAGESFRYSFTRIAYSLRCAHINELLQTIGL
jgi:hypothetical protein